MGRGWEGVCVGMVGMRVVEADVAVGLAGGVSVCHGENFIAFTSTLGLCIDL